MNYITLLSLFSALVCLYLAYFVFSLGKKNPRNRLFSILCLVMFFTNFCVFMFRQSDKYEYVLFWSMAYYFFPVIMPISFHFILVFTGKTSLANNKLFLFILYFPAFFFTAIINFFLIADSDYSHSFINLVINGFGRIYSEFNADSHVLNFLSGWLLTGWIDFLIIVTLVICVRSYFKSNDFNFRKQVKFITTGLAIQFIGGAFFIGILPYIFKVQIPEADPLIKSMMMMIFAYGIWKYDLFKIDPVTAADNIINTMSESLLLIDMHGKIIEVNKVLMNITEYKKNELMSMSLSDLFDEKSIFDGFISSFDKSNMISGMELTLFSRSGKRIPVIFSASVIRNNAKQMCGIVCVATDISKRKLAELELTRTLSALEDSNRELRENHDKLLLSEKLASLGRLTAGLVHEMTSPLAAVRNLLFVVTSKINESKTEVAGSHDRDHTGEDVEIIGLIKKADSLINKVLNFIKSIKSQTSEMEQNEKTVFNLAEIINESILLTNYLLVPNNLTFEFNCDNDDMVLSGIPGRLRLVITNLIRNSVDAMNHRKGGIVRINLKENGNEVIIQVEDQGCGIPEYIMSKIYDPFFTTKTFGSSIGLGLTMVHDIVYGEFGGEIEIESKIDRGTCFTLIFKKEDVLQESLSNGTLSSPELKL
jgi:PAS domain S-box-containing protein